MAAPKKTALASRMIKSMDERRDEAAKTNSATLGDVGKLAARQMKLEDEIEVMETDLRAKKAELEEVSTKLLPQAMTAVNLDDFSLKGGAKVQVNNFYSASIKEENKPAALKWLRTNGFGPLIKRMFEIPFGTGEDKKASQFKKQLQKEHYPFSEAEGVHAQTLKAFIREQIEDGNPKKVPLDLFGAFIGRKAKIIRPKP